jgi:hypothetical protein
MTRKLRIVVLGIMGRTPFAGLAWEALHYVEGFRRLGHDVYYIEDSQDWPFDPDRRALTEDPTYTVNFIAQNLELCGMADRWAYRAVAQENRIYGLSDTQFTRVFEEAELLVNVCGATMLRDEHLRVPVRAYVETDPGLPQIELARGDPSTHELLGVHTHHFTFAENLGSPDCGLPQGPFPYRFTRQPIVLDWFTPDGIRPAPAPSGTSNGRCFTTVSSWKQTTNDIEWNGQLYTWSKHTEFLKFIDLPRRIGRTLEIALACDEPDVIDLFTAKGWRIRDALALTRDIWPYRDYVVGSPGEFTVAKDQNVRLRSGWFSERSASYLTASKPVITQDTGFGVAIPSGEGLFAYNTMEEIVAAFEAIDGDYQRHSRAARAIAEEYFRAEKVLARLIDDIGL